MLVDFDVRALHDTADGERPIAYAREVGMGGGRMRRRRPMTAGFR